MGGTSGAMRRFWPRAFRATRPLAASQPTDQVFGSSEAVASATP